MKTETLNKGTLLKSTKKIKSFSFYETQNYHKFKLLNGNRNINKLHLKKLKDSILDQYLLTIITVNEKYEIIDGQHRFLVCKELDLPIRYIIVNGYGLKEVQKLNANTKNWNADDYMNAYCDLGYRNYLYYKEFKNKYKLGHNECQLLLAGKHIKGQFSDFTNGKLQIQNKKKACEYAEHIISLKDYYDGYKRRSFIYTIINLLNNKKFDINLFIKKLKIQPNAIYDCTSVNQYTLLIEDIYNYRNRNKVNLRY